MSTYPARPRNDNSHNHNHKRVPSSNGSDKTADMTLASNGGNQPNGQAQTAREVDPQQNRLARQRHINVVEDLMASMDRKDSKGARKQSSRKKKGQHHPHPHQHTDDDGDDHMNGMDRHNGGSSNESVTSSQWSSSSSSSSYDSDEGSTLESFDFSSLYSDSEMYDRDGSSSYDSSSLSESGLDDEDDSELNDAMMGGARDVERLLGPRRRPPATKPTAKVPPPPPPIEGLGALTPEGLPIAFAKLKKDLEKVGRTIISSNVGGVIAERAHILASINWLSSHVPNAVLDELGHEIRTVLEDRKAMSVMDNGLNIIENDDMSRVSDLSDDANNHNGGGGNANPDARGPQHPRQRTLSGGTITSVSGGNGRQLSGLKRATPAVTNASSFARNNSTRSMSPKSRGGSITPASRRRVQIMGASDTSRLPSAPPMVITSPAATSRLRQRNSEVSLFSIDDTAQYSKGMESMSSQQNSTSVLGQSNDGSQSTRRRNAMRGHFQRFVKRQRDSKRFAETSSLQSTSNHAKKPPSFHRLDVPMNDTGSLDSEDERFFSQSSVVPTNHTPSNRSNRKLRILDNRTVSICEINSEAIDDDDDEDYDGTNNILERRRAARERLRGLQLPTAAQYQCALLFVDISGFTKLSQVLDPESLSKAINSYFQLIVDEVIAGHGDLLKFAGDAVFIEWKATKDLDLERCVEAASICAGKIVSRCADFLVLSNGAHGGSSCVIESQAETISQLNVHCGIGAGQMVGVHVGDHKLRREYLLLGQPIQQATVATEFAAMGEVALSREAVALLTKVCKVDQSYAGMSISMTGPSVIANRSITNFTPKGHNGALQQQKTVNAFSRGVTRHVDGLEVEALKEYRRKMSLYVHPVVVGNDVAASDNFKANNTKQSAQERHREEAELRNVYCIFVCPKIDVNVTRNEKKNRQMYKMLNDIMNLASREVDRYSGHLRQFIVDDKGLVIIITFGLRGTTVPDMVAQRGLPATIALHNALQMELGVQSRVGATIGESYCGVVGGVKRHEYAVLGPSVNLAARLMASKTNPGILVDNKVRMMANRSYGFNALPPVVAKGYKDPVPIFEPLSPLERMWGKILPNFVGRRREIMGIMSLARDMLLKQAEPRSKMVFVTGASGVGKTTMVTHCIEHIRKLLGANKHRLLVTKNVSKESDALVPFGIFHSILRDVLAAVTLSSDDRSYKSGATFFSAFQNSIGWESLSGHSVSQASLITSSKAAEIFHLVCRELDIQQSFVDHAIHHILGETHIRSKNKHNQTRPPTPKALVSFVARVFKRCVQDFRLVILAVDDLQHADELSWRVIREVYEITDNVLIISTMNQVLNVIPRVEPNFWDALKVQESNNGRFIPMELGCLNMEEIASMIMKTLGLQRDDVNVDFLSGITIQSGGMPHFVNEILEYMKRLTAMDADVEISDITYDSFGDLVLQRLDSFDLNTRDVLNIGAVLGQSFNSEEVIDVQNRSSDATRATVTASASKSFDIAVREGILQRAESDDQPRSDHRREYSFVHAVWRTAILNLMLEGRKRDLHAAIAQMQEAKGIELDDYMFQMKLFSHWKASENFAKSAELALQVGKHFEEKLGLPIQSIRLYNESLDMVRDGTDTAVGISGFTSKTLRAASRIDLMSIIRLQVALGQALNMAQQMTDSVTAYQDALRILQAAKASAELENRSILFPVFVGLSLALKRGHIIQDAECRYEQAMIRRYVQETQRHGDPVFTIHAISLQTEMYSRLGNFTQALECHKRLAAVYNADRHSAKLCDEFGSDIGALSYSLRTLWSIQVGRPDEALGTCWFIIEELMPRIEGEHVHTLFMTIFPALWVMKENGFALEVREYFEEFVCEPYEKYYGEGRSTFFLPMYDPIMMLLDLSGKADVDQMMVEEYLEWALDVDNLGFGTLLNAKTGELGRTADSIAGEICYLLAQHVEDEDDRNILLQNAIDVIQEDIEFTKKHKLILAQLYSEKLLTSLEHFDDEDQASLSSDEFVF